MWHATQRVALMCGAAAIASGALLRAQWRRVEPAIDRLGEFLRRTESRRFDAIVVLVTLLAVHGVALWRGELRMDDYIFLREARSGLHTVLLQPWAGHFSPLWRLETVVIYRMWGPHSAAFRWWDFAQVSVLAYASARLLAAWGVARGGRLLATVVLCGWTQWAQVTMGYWTMSICVKILILIAIGVRAVIADDWPVARRKAVIAICTLGAVLVDSPGALIVPAIVIASVAWHIARDDKKSLRAAVRESEWTIAMAGIATMIVVGGHWIATMDSAAWVGPPSVGSAVGLALFLSTFGTVGAAVMPAVSTQLPRAVLAWTSFVVPLAGAGAIALTWRRSSSVERAALASLLAMIGAAVALLSAARGYEDHSFMVLWTHHIRIPLRARSPEILGVVWQVWWGARPGRPGIQAQWLVLALIAFLGARETGGAIADRLVQAGRGWGCWNAAASSVRA